MPMVFPNIDALQVFVNNNIKENHNEEITGPIANDAFNGCIEFIRQSPLNYGKASIESSGGAVIASTGVVVFTGITPTSLTWGDDIYNEYVFVNTTSNVIPLLGALVYYNLTGSPVAAIPPNSIINVFKANNDLWIQGNNPGGGAGTGTVTSVGLTMPTDIFDVANSPILSAGDLVVTKKVQAANTFFRGPTSGVPAVPTFGIIVPGDVPFIFPETNSFIIDGGQIVWVQNLDYNVSAANYVIDDTQYASAETPITLAPSNPTFDRIDLVLVNTAGNVVVITGTPSANPQQPSYNQSTQLPLSFILVTAGSTQPACASLTTVYKEDAGTPTEWATVSSDASIVVNSTNNPRTGTKDIEGTNAVGGATVTFTPLAAFNSNGFTQLDMYIRSKGTWANSLLVTFYDIGGQIGNAVEVSTLASFGFDSSVVGSYQQVGIPKELFGLAAATMITSMKFTILGATSTMGFYIDDISLEHNCLIPPPQTSIGFINGITRTGNVVQWGGDLRHPTSINQNGNNLTFYQSNTGAIFVHDVGTYKPAQIFLQDGNNFLTSIQSNGEIRGWQQDLYLSGYNQIKNVVSHLYGGVTLNPDSISVFDFILKSGRSQLSKGANIVAANNLTLGTDGNSFTVTGNTQVNAITTANWQAGSTAYLLFTGTPTVKNNTAGGAGTATILLAGAVDFTAASGDILSLLYDGTNWRETTRKLAASTGGGSVTSFSAGTLSPLFTTSVATATTTPALTFALTNAAGGTVFGNNTGSSAAPAYTAVPVLGIAGTTKGTLGFAGNTSGVVSILPQAIAGTYNFNLPITAGTSGQVLTSAGGVAAPMTWTTPSTAALTVPISGLLAGTGTNTINSGAFAQEWQWNTLAGTDGLKLSSTSTAAASNLQKVLNVSLSGVNGTSAQTTYAIDASNTHSGTTSVNIAVRGISSGATRSIGVLGTDGTASVIGVPTGNIGVSAIVNTGNAFFAEATGATAVAMFVQALTSNSMAQFVNFGSGSAIYASGTSTSGTIRSINNGGGSGTSGVFAESLLSNLGVALNVLATGDASNDATAAKFVAVSGVTNNYAIIVPAASGNVGFGTSTPTATRLEVVDNSLAGANMVSLTSTSIAAASDLQKILNISLSGVNTTSTQTTYGAYISNTHSGTNSTNYGLYSTATSGAANTAIYGTATNVGVHGNSSGGIGTEGQTTTGTGIYGISFGAGIGVFGYSATGLPLSLQAAPSSTNTVVQGINLLRTSSGTPANGIGVEMDFSVSTTSTTNIIANGLISKWTDATHATRTSQFIITGVNSGTTGNKLVISGSGAIGVQQDTPTAWMHLGAGTTSFAQLRLDPGVAPSAPNDGDIYYINTADRLMFFKNATACEIISASAVTTEVLVSDTTLTITFNGTTYKLLARA